MVSAWWLVAAFIAGGYAGILIVALMRFAANDSEPSRPDRSSDVGFANWSSPDQGPSTL